MRLPFAAGLLVLAVTLVLAHSAEANDVKLTLKSLPEGATVFTILPDGSEKMWGTAPVRLKWQVPRRWAECITTESIKVRWISGVEATVSGVDLCPRVGKNQEFVFQRPAEAPGVELDVQYAIALMRSAATAAAARARSYVPYVPPPREKICTSNIIGNQIFTYCY